MPQYAQAKEEIQLDITPLTPVFPADERQTTYLHIGLTCFDTQVKKGLLVPLNMALVIDGSMQPEKIHQAKEVAMMMVTRLRPTDLIAIIAYDQQAKVLLPTTKARRRKMITQVIQTLFDEGQTTHGAALFDGLKQGAREILQGQQPYQMNRMILLSDGFANVVPDSLAQLSEFGRVLSEENMTVTTISLGPDEHLMRQLSQQTNGNHAVIEKATDIIGAFEQELTEMASVVAQEVNVTLNFSENLRPITVLDREAEFKEQTVLIKLGQLYNEQEKDILVELEIPPISTQQERAFAEITFAYYNLKTHRHRHLNEKVWLIVNRTNSGQNVLTASEYIW